MCSGKFQIENTSTNDATKGPKRNDTGFKNKIKYERVSKNSTDKGKNGDESEKILAEKMVAKNSSAMKKMATSLKM